MKWVFSTLKRVFEEDKISFKQYSVKQSAERSNVWNLIQINNNKSHEQKKTNKQTKNPIKIKFTELQK